MPQPKPHVRKKPLSTAKIGASAKNSFLTATEACALLGVKPQTLYAYVSRGQLRAEARSDGHGHLYSREEVESLLARSRARSGHGPTAASAMRWGEPILDSAITCIQNDMVHYRGHALSHLLRSRVPFENVAELLWSGELPVQPVGWPSEGKDLSQHKKTQQNHCDGGTSVARRLLFRVSAVALADREGQDELLDESLRRARRLILAIADELFPSNSQSKTQRESSISVKIAASLGFRENEVASRAINAALIVSADHELNASTFAARVAASTGADLYACILAGVAAFSGRHHGLSPVETYHFVNGLSSDRSANMYLKDRIANDKIVPGFGHPLYPKGDPRAALMLENARQLAEQIGGVSLQRMKNVSMLIDAAKSQGLQPPNLDLGLVGVALVLGLTDIGASSLFVLGRIAGWTAHIIEQRQQGFLLRPRARYNGRAPLDTKQ